MSFTEGQKGNCTYLLGVSAILLGACSKALDS